MLLPFLLLTQRVPPVLFRFPLLPLPGFPLKARLLPLELQRLLRLGADAPVPQLVVDLPLHPFGIYLPGPFPLAAWAFLQQGCPPVFPGCRFLPEQARLGRAFPHREISRKPAPPAQVSFFRLPLLTSFLKIWSVAQNLP